MTPALRFGERLRDLRHAAGLTQAALARAIGVRVESLRRWEYAARAPQTFRLPRIAGALSVPLEALFCEDGFVPLATFVLSPESVARLTSPATREQALEQLHAALSAQLRLELERAQPLKPARARARRRRSREELLLAQARRFEALGRRTEQRRRTERRTIE